MLLEIRPQSTDPALQIEPLRIDEITSLIVIAGPEDGARLLLALRQLGFSGPIFGSPRLARRSCLDRAGDAARGMRVPALADFDAESDERRAFEIRFRERTGVDPDWAAAHTYDATRLLLAAIAEAGLSRPAIREALLDVSPWRGITGTIDWDPTGQNRRSVTAMATVRDARLVVDGSP